MSRRSFISITTINRLAVASNRAKKANYNNALIKAQGGNTKELPPIYSLTNVDFNIATRVAKIEIRQSQKYRTIQRYVTQNYVKYPIFSEWKLREKIINKTLKLTNAELESLNVHPDNLIKMFAEEIVIQLNNEELFPSWFILLYLRKELDEDLQHIQQELNLFVDSQNQKIEKYKRDVRFYNDEKQNFVFSLSIQDKKKNKITKKLAKLSSLKPNILKTILSFGLYGYFISVKRQSKLNSQLSKINNFIQVLKKTISTYNTNIENSLASINDLKTTISEKETAQTLKRELRFQEYNNKCSHVQPLSNMVAKDESFMPLKLFSGLEYEKIIGVYVIHNKENDKCYVGQSKDVMKRLKQHFNGTIPRNVIFSEDYYTSQIENKENLFEVKIIPCETKDELDRLEKHLIGEYNSWQAGYNSTSGNI